MSSYCGCSIYNSAGIASATRILISVQPDAIKMQRRSPSSSAPDRKQLACQALPSSLVCSFKKRQGEPVCFAVTHPGDLSSASCDAGGGCEGEQSVGGWVEVRAAHPVMWARRLHSSRAPGWFVPRETGSNASLRCQQECGQSPGRAERGKEGPGCYAEAAPAHFGNLMSKADRDAVGMARWLMELLATALVGLAPVRSPSR